ncbi:MAG: hypothetical protein Q8P56_06660, partial [Candidatus Uhrbacteria bacterium]|nr:hypothetical protein [Candidatus Uhrbacteria bacterium]
NFFPKELSPFGYNETLAVEKFPLTKDEALKQGFKWEDSPRGTFGKETVKWENVPDSITETANMDVPKQVFTCTSCQKTISSFLANLISTNNSKFHCQDFAPTADITADSKLAVRIAPGLENVCAITKFLITP